MNLVMDIYTMCKDIPESEKYHMISQLQRCSTSIPANIAEGHGRNSIKDFQRFLFIARGSAFELETFLILAERVHAIETQELQKNTQEIQKMISGLIKSISN